MRARMTLIEWESAKLYRQPGGYAVSCVELDELVYIAMDVEGVLGAGRTGAGLGGCISVLLEKDRTSDLIQNGFWGILPSAKSKRGS